MKTETAIKYFGGIPSLAKHLDITRQAIYQWGDVVPIAQALLLERQTGGALKYDERDYKKNRKLNNQRN